MTAESAGFARLKAVVNAYGYEFETIPSEAPVTTRDLSLPTEFCLLYEDNGPVEGSTVPWVIEELSIFGLGELADAQAGYRWTGPERRLSEVWSPHWVVIASVFGDPFLVDTSQDGCPVFFARHGGGTWALQEIAPSMETFIEALVVFESVLLGRFRLDVWGDSGILPQFVEEVESALSNVLSADRASRFAALLG